MTHTDAALIVYSTLRNQGARLAYEAGIPGGRVDVVRVADDGRWLELFEVKLRAAASGIPQLLRYQAAAPDNSRPRLTLVVPLSLVTTRLQETAMAAGVRVWAFNFSDGIQEWLFDSWPPSVHLPYLQRSTP